jgi:hypothetical protein
MKTLGRILIILTAFALVMGITYTVVSAASSAAGAPAFGRGEEGFPRAEGVRPQSPGGEGREFRGPRGGLRWILGVVKNIGIIAIIVALVVWLKDFVRSRSRDVRQEAE